MAASLDVCCGCDIVAQSECPVRGPGCTAAWVYMEGPGGAESDELCSLCWGTSASCFPWLKSKSELKLRLSSDPEFKHGKFKTASQCRISLLRAKAEQLRAEGKDLQTAKIYVRMTGVAKDPFTEDKCKKTVSHALVAQDLLEVKAMFLTEAAYKIHVGDPKKLKPEGLYIWKSTIALPPPPPA